jgi:hypothetical protein
LYRAYVPPASLFRLTLFSQNHAYIMTKHADSSGHGAIELLDAPIEFGERLLRFRLAATRESHPFGEEQLCGW